MADSLHIGITLAGQKDINDLIKQLNTVGGSINDVAKVQKAMNAAFKDTQPGKLRDSLGKAVVGLKEYNAVALQGTMTANGKMMQSYFTLGERLRQFTASMTFGGLAARQFGGELDHVANMAKAKYSDAMASGSSSMLTFESGAVAASIGVIGLSAALLGAIYKLKDFAMAGARIEMLRSQIEALATKEGTHAINIIGALTKATGGEVTELELLQKALEFKLVGTPFSKLPALFELIEYRSHLLNLSFSETANLILKAELGQGNRAAKTLRMNIIMEDVEASYAASIGKTSDKLNEQEKRLAFITAVLQAAGTQQDELSGATMKTVESIERLNTAVENLKNTASGMAGIFEPVWSRWAAQVNEMRIFLMWLDTLGKDKLATKTPAQMGGVSNKPRGAIAEWFATGAMTPPMTKAKEKEILAAEELAQYEKERVVWLQKYWDLMQKTGEQEIAEGLSKRWLGREAKPGRVGGVKGVAGVGEIEPLTKELSAAQMASNQLADSMSGSFQEATSYLAQGFATAFGLGNSLLDRMISTFATSALMALPGMIANMMTAGATGNIFTALFAMLASGGDVTTGGPLRFAASGGNFNYGKLQNVIVGERGPELMQVARNGVRIISNDRMREVNQMSQASRNGGGSTMQPYIKVVPITDDTGLAVRVEVGNRINKTNRRY